MRYTNAIAKDINKELISENIGIDGSTLMFHIIKIHEKWIKEVVLPEALTNSDKINDIVNDGFGEFDMENYQKLLSNIEESVNHYIKGKPIANKPVFEIRFLDKWVFATRSKANGLFNEIVNYIKDFVSGCCKNAKSMKRA